MENDDMHKYMERCIELAKMSPVRIGKPLVGAIIIDLDGKIVGEGYKAMLDGTRMIVHAERMALNEAGDYARGGTLITTLEPCTQAARNRVFKPCGELIVEKGIKKVVFGLKDNSPYVNSYLGANYLAENGIEIVEYSDMDSIIKHELMPENHDTRLYRLPKKR